MGFWLGILFLLALDKLVPHLHQGGCGAEGLPCGLGRSAMLTFAVALHNLPEGMAVGVVYAGLMTGAGEITAAGALALSLGIAIQNFPEGAIISMPLRAEGNSKGKSFVYGFLSGLVEPLGAVLTILLASVMVPVLPYALSFAAGAMLYVVVEELIPEMSEGEHSNIGVLCFSLGFTLMMILDVALGVSRQPASSTFPVSSVDIWRRRCRFGRDRIPGLCRRTPPGRIRRSSNRGRPGPPMKPWPAYPD